MASAICKTEDTHATRVPSTVSKDFASKSNQHHNSHLVPQTSKGLLEVSTLLAYVIGQENADFWRAFACARPEWSARLFCSLSGKLLARVSKGPSQKYFFIICKTGSRICKPVYSSGCREAKIVFICSYNKGLFTCVTVQKGRPCVPFCIQGIYTVTT